jgi:hypothetical protein
MAISTIIILIGWWPKLDYCPTILKNTQIILRSEIILEESSDSKQVFDKNLARLISEKLGCEVKKMSDSTYDWLESGIGNFIPYVELSYKRQFLLSILYNGLKDKGEFSLRMTYCNTEIKTIMKVIIIVTEDHPLTKERLIERITNELVVIYYRIDSEG